MILNPPNPRQTRDNLATKARQSHSNPKTIPLHNHAKPATPQKTRRDPFRLTSSLLPIVPIRLIRPIRPIWRLLPVIPILSRIPIPPTRPTPPNPPNLLLPLCYLLFNPLPAPAPQSILDTLTPAQLERLDALLENYSLRNAANLLATPPPTGLSLTVSKDILQRYVKGKQREARRAQSAEAREYAASVLADPNLTDAQISTAGRHLLRVRILDSILDENTPLKEAADLQWKSDRLRLIDLAERRLALAEQKQKPKPQSLHT